MTVRDEIQIFLRQRPSRPYCAACIREVLGTASIDDIRHAFEIIERQFGFLPGRQTICTRCGQYRSAVSAT